MALCAVITMHLSSLNFHIVTELGIVYFTNHKIIKKTNRVPTYYIGSSFYAYFIGIYEKP